jgi:DNA-binding NarL/FixJ family response regulator
METSKGFPYFFIYNQGKRVQNSTLTTQPLTLRELDILELQYEGLNNIEIGDRLFISKNTVKYHIRNIYNKTSVNNRTELKEKLASNYKPETNDYQLINT